jgi:hypothetical protein
MMSDQGSSMNYDNLQGTEVNETAVLSDEEGMECLKYHDINKVLL